MKLYIDKENIIAFITNRSEDTDLFDESVRMIKRGLEINYNFPKSEIPNNPVLIAWFGKMNGCGVRFSSIFRTETDIKPERPVKSNFYNNYDSEDRCSIYLLNIDENTCNSIRNKYSILVGRPGDEMEVFRKLLEIPERTGMMSNITSWADYCPKLPITDVIVCDNYYFKDIDVYDKNNNELIRALASISKDVLNVVFFIKHEVVDPKIKLDVECTKIKNMISSVSGLSKGRCSVTIITTNRTHSRHIITNYYRISPTTCVHLKENGLKEDANISINPHTEPREMETTKSLIDTFQDIAKSPVGIFGDKKSNFIKFE